MWRLALRIGVSAIAMSIASWSAASRASEMHDAAIAGAPVGHEAPAAPGPAVASPPASGPIAPETGFIPDAPRRMPDGTFFVPKPSQRLLSIRTVITAPTEVPRTDEIPGHVVADPNASGQVQSHQTGRIEPVEGGMPLVGMQVTKGQILAYVLPAVSRVERGTLYSQAADLAVDIEKAERRVAFLRDFPIVPFRDRKLEAARIELEGLRKRYELLTRALSAKVPLRAPVDGVVAGVHATTGQIVEAREPVFDIIDPSRLLVQATAIDAHVPDQVRGAVARTTAGDILPLRFVGRGPRLREQAVPMTFAIDTPVSRISVGTPVTIIVQGSDRQIAIALPRDSVVRAAGGETLVWEKVSAETFVARPVRVQAIDGDTVSVLAGLASGVRAVTGGANFLNNIR
jgi:multidrug efflux pump subunit AcrA (membrane-fusion protein)